MIHYEGEGTTVPDKVTSKPATRRRLWGRVLAMLGLFGFAFYMMMPSLGPHPEGTRRTLCRNNLKQIGLALHSYHDVYGTFPPAYISDEHGRPLHSWRVLILPYVDQQELYDQYKFDEPWDGPHNISLLEKMPPLYRCPSHEDAEAAMTDYAAVVGDACVMRGTITVTVREITDGMTNTIVIGEAAGARIRWTEPRDVSFGAFTRLGDVQSFNSEHGSVSGAFALHADGWVQFLSEDVPAETLKSMFTRAGGEEVPPY